MPNSNPDVAKQLLDAVKGLEKSTSELAKQTEENEVDILKGKRKTRILLISVLADVFLSILVALFGTTVFQNQGKIQNIQQEQQSETGINREGQCAVINLFLQSEANVKARPNSTPEEKADQIRAYKTLHELYDETLNCDNK